MSEVRVYSLEEKDVHMVGDYVGVVWNVEIITEPVQTVWDEGAGTITMTIPRKARVPSAQSPYIDFLWIRERDGEAWEDEDSPVGGGLTAQQAAQVAAELTAAVQYLRTKTRG